MNEQQAPAGIRRIEFRQKIGLGAVLLALLATLACVSKIIAGGADEMKGGVWIGAGAFAVIALVVGIVLQRTAQIPEAARSGEVGFARLEAKQAKRRIAFLMVPFSLGLMLNGVERATARTVEGLSLRGFELFEISSFVFFLAAFAWLLLGGGIDRWARSVLDDELTRDLRGRALRLGYLFLLSGVAGLFILGLFRRDLAVEAAPILAALGVAAPAVRFAWLERAANTPGAER